MTALAERLIAQIRETGPMRIADYMSICLTHPELGYYTRRDPLGVAGDFVTAPEISQMFGELVGLALAQTWLDQGAPPTFRLVELGPGRGTLMADALRATAHVPGFHNAADLWLVEVSPALRDIQRATIPRPFHHADRLEDIPDGPVFLIANEFFDALPLRQFVRDGDAWRERVVGVADGRLVFGLTGPMMPRGLEARLPDTQDGDMIEISSAAEAIAAELGARLASGGGAALIVDYGSWGSRGDTFQAVRRHEKVDPLAAPGDADLTAHVDFRALAQAAAPAAASRLTPQGVFLERLGITRRAHALAAGLAGEALDRHIAAHRRLTHPDEMGTLFQVLALHAPGTPPLPGLDP